MSHQQDTFKIRHGKANIMIDLAIRYKVLVDFINIFIQSTIIRNIWLSKGHEKKGWYYFIIIFRLEVFTRQNQLKYGQHVLWWTQYIV